MSAASKLLHWSRLWWKSLALSVLWRYKICALSVLLERWRWKISALSVLLQWWRWKICAQSVLLERWSIKYLTGRTWKVLMRRHPILTFTWLTRNHRPCSFLVSNGLTLMRQYNMLTLSWLTRQEILGGVLGTLTLNS